MVIESHLQPRSSLLFIVPDIASAEYAETVAGIRAALCRDGRARVKVDQFVYDVVVVEISGAPERRIYVALNGRREFMKRTVAELISELVSVISSGSWSEFEFREDTDPADALEDITGSFFKPPAAGTGRKKRISSGGGAAVRRRRTSSVTTEGSASTPGL